MTGFRTVPGKQSGLGTMPLRGKSEFGTEVESGQSGLRTANDVDEGRFQFSACQLGLVVSEYYNKTMRFIRTPSHVLWYSDWLKNTTSGGNIFVANHNTNSVDYRRTWEVWCPSSGKIIHLWRITSLARQSSKVRPLKHYGIKQFLVRHHLL